jgi:hypothetical protein
VTLAVTFYGSTKTAASEYLQIRAQIRTAKETSLIVNGGHYMTRGHVILCLLYLKKRRMSRNILELKREPFRVCKRTIAKVVPPYFPAPTEGDPLSFLQPTVRVKAPPPHARREWGGRKYLEVFHKSLAGVFFSTHPNGFSRPILPQPLLHTRGKSESSERRGQWETAETNHACYCLSSLFIKTVLSCAGCLQIGRKRSACWCGYCKGVRISFHGGRIRRRSRGRIGA